MATIKTKYEGDLRTFSTHIASGNEIITDAPKDNHGKGEAFSPTDLVSAALGACMLSIMGIAAKTHDIEFRNVTLENTKIMASDPRRIAEISIEFYFNGMEYNDHQKLILERAARTCPVALSLHPDLKQTIVFNW
ncbi:MAG: OsmC family protein [Bacteroidia bacterium]|jgi:putative redox protein|nr:OsmC family protein [Bacteroidia bacterium]